MGGNFCCLGGNFMTFRHPDTLLYQNDTAEAKTHLLKNKLYFLQIRHLLSVNIHNFCSLFAVQ